MKVVIPGGTGQLGRILRRAFVERGAEVVVLGRCGGPGVKHWDGRSPGRWTAEIDGADIVINLAGRSVNCRYTVNNLRDMMDSRVFSTRAIGRAIEQAVRPPRLWLQMSTATIYAHRYDADNDERNGILGGEEPDAPTYWRYSTDIAHAWERTLDEADTPRTRKVALRLAMVMSTERGGVLSTLLGLTRFGLGGTVGGGRQFLSWIHEEDFVRAIDFLIEHEEIDGVVNVSAPNPVPQRQFMASLRRAWGIGFGVPATAWMLEIAALVHRTDTELLLKSRRVVPGRLLEAGFRFHHPEWEAAARDLVERWRRRRGNPSAQARAA